MLQKVSRIGRGGGLLTVALLVVWLTPFAADAGLDGDGHVDAVYGNDETENELCFGDGAGDFASCTDFSSDFLVVIGVAAHSV